MSPTYRPCCDAGWTQDMKGVGGGVGPGWIMGLILAFYKKTNESHSVGLADPVIKGRAEVQPSGPLQLGFWRHF